MNSPRTHKDYTIGWICPLPKEMAAATIMLDEEHGDLDQPLEDLNAYILGSIESHNIAIAGLPMGQYGTVSAATTAMSLIRTFPAVRVVLLVGIGAGVPTQGLKLGDVVVGVPSGPHPGVVQWDFGKEESDGFKRTGCLNNPPPFILTALTKLRSKLYLRSSNVNRYIEAIRIAGGHDARTFLPDKSMKDVLFSSMYSHIQEEHYSRNSYLPRDLSAIDFDRSENDCPSCDINKAARIIDIHNTDVKIHFGLIASGNRLIKNPFLREKLRSDIKGDLLCIEMEAAGMNNFPCLAIRGICDYADTHKNDSWQEFAALTAAAFAKELVVSLPRDSVTAEIPVQEVWDKLEKIESSVRSIENRSVSIASVLQESKYNQILHWLGRSYSNELNTNLRNKCPETGQWVIETAEFQNWINNDRDEERDLTLFCPGDPGTGKTMLASIIIQHLFDRYRSDAKTCIIYLYCSYAEKLKLEDLASSVLRQLAQNISSLPMPIQHFWESFSKQGLLPSLEALFHTFCNISQNFARIFVVADALDECCCTSEFLEWMFRLQKATRLSFLATSRGIRSVLREFETTASLTLPIKAFDFDVRLLIQHELSHSRVLDIATELVDEDTRSRLIDRLAGLAKGMILLSKLYLKFLEGLTTWSEIQRLLDRLPDRTVSISPENSVECEHQILYDDAYEKTMIQAKSQSSQRWIRAKRSFYWILFSKKSLSISVFRHAISIERGQPDFEPENVPNMDTILKVCRGLVVIDQADDTVRFVHQTTHEYFRQTWKDWFPEAKTELATAMATYLLYTCHTMHAARLSRTGGTSRSKFNKNGGGVFPGFEPFGDYSLYDRCARGWGHHARDSAGGDKEVNPYLFDRLLSHRPYLEEWKIDYKARGCMPSYNLILWPHESWDGFYLASHIGLTGPAQVIWNRRPSDAIVQNHLNFALAMAASSGQTEMVSWLLDRGAEIDARFEHGTALSLAAYKCHLDVAAVLLMREADVNARSSIFNISQHPRVYKYLYKTTPLMLAASCQHQEMMILLIKNGANLYAEDKDGTTAVRILARSGQKKTLCELLEWDSQRSTKYCALSTALYEFIRLRKLDSAENFLEHFQSGVSIDLGWRSEEGRSLVYYVVREPSGLQLLRILMERGVDPDVKDDEGRTATMWAAIKHDNSKIIEELLPSELNKQLDMAKGWTRKYTDPMTKDFRGLTALTYALYGERTQTTHALLNHLSMQNSPYDAPTSKGSSSYDIYPDLNISDIKKSQKTTSDSSTLMVQWHLSYLLGYIESLNQKRTFNNWADRAQKWMKNRAEMLEIDRRDGRENGAKKYRRRMPKLFELPQIDFHIPYMASKILLSDNSFASGELHIKIDEAGASALRASISSAKNMDDIDWILMLAHRDLRTESQGSQDITQVEAGESRYFYLRARGYDNWKRKPAVNDIFRVPVHPTRYTGMSKIENEMAKFNCDISYKETEVRSDSLTTGGCQYNEFSPKRFESPMLECTHRACPLVTGAVYWDCCGAPTPILFERHPFRTRPEGILSPLLILISKLERAFERDMLIAHDRIISRIKRCGGVTTALMWAAGLGYAKAVKILISYGAVVDECDDSGRTALHWAAIGQSVPSIFRLLKAQTNNLSGTERDRKYVELERIILSAWRRTDDEYME